MERVSLPDAVLRALSKLAAITQDLALQYSEHAVAVVFDLAFRLGEQQMLGEMIEARAGDVVLPAGVGEP
ncbi:hypothetical protein [uncultured Tessaracoccus sp.]|uniref:hypothetical protein n=1 Tax=uncultured Tessaracoccus sp. TaxID=905023 RepID=UPI0026213732|nr:hypothetical protein [uncultured Tessaracoccus sp.]